MLGVGLYIEENLQEIVSRYHAAVARGFGVAEPALSLAAPVLLRDIAKAMRAEVRPAEPWKRAALLVLSQPQGGIRGLLLEFAALRRALWEALSARGHAVPSDERRAVDLFLDEAMADASERWANLVRLGGRAAGPTTLRPVPPPLPHHA